MHWLTVHKVNIHQQMVTIARANMNTYKKARTRYTFSSFFTLFSFRHHRRCRRHCRYSEFYYFPYWLSAECWHARIYWIFGTEWNTQNTSKYVYIEPHSTSHSYVNVRFYLCHTWAEKARARVECTKTL